MTFGLGPLPHALELCLGGSCFPADSSGAIQRYVGFQPGVTQRTFDLVGDHPTKADASYVAKSGPIGPGSGRGRSRQSSQSPPAREKVGEPLGRLTDGID